MWEQMSDFCHGTGKVTKNILAVLFFFFLSFSFFLNSTEFC